MDFLGGPKLVLINCLSGEKEFISKWPFVIGSGNEACDLVLDDAAYHAQQCEITSAGKKITVRSLTSLPLKINGTDCLEDELQRDKDYSLQLGNSLFSLRLSRHSEKWSKSIMTDAWCVQHKSTGITEGPFKVGQVAQYISNGVTQNEHVVYLRGTKAGFFSESVANIFDALSDEEGLVTDISSPEPVEPEVETLSGEHGSLTCPTCWLKFDPGDAKHVAVHESLKGDPLLGPGEMKRFTANRYADNGVALDPMGIMTMDIACPHCHRRLPPDFLDIKHHIISIVGAPTAGKSYFLCVFTQMLKKSLFTRFGTSFIDADPTANAHLTSMSDTLFGSSTAEQAKVAKTDLEGDMYERLTRHGRKVMLPKPFIFNIQPPKTSGNEGRAVIFYDNAGEHFQPGIDQTESPGTLHLAASSGIIFLFDPTYNKEFRRRLPEHEDPQLRISGHADIQDTILAEAKVRVKKVLGLDARTKLDTPLAVVVGKFDVWRDLLNTDSIAQPMEESEFNQGAVEENSQVVRDLMMEVCPQVVSGAEAISNNVKYFPVSSFGCSPETIGYVQDAQGKDIPILSPNPENINPILVEVPMVWLLSQIEPQLVPSRQ